MHRHDGSKPGRYPDFERERTLASRVAELEAELEAVRRAERDAHDQLERAAVPLIALAPDGRVRWMNHEAAELLGRPKLEVVGRPWVAEVVPEPERARSERFYRELLAGGVERTTIEVPIVTARGVRIVAFRNALFRDETGAVTGALCAGEDVTEALRALSELELLGRAIEDASDAVIVTDREGVVTYVNPAFERTTGRTRAEITGRNARELLPREAIEAFHAALLAALKDGRSWSGRLEGRRRDGSVFHEDATISPVRAPNDDPMGYVVVSRDVTEHAKMEARLRMVDRIESIGRFAGGIAHDFNNLLTVILGTCEMALPELPEGSSLHRDLSDILDAAQRAALLTGQLLTFSRKQVLQPEPLHLCAILEGMVTMLERLLGPTVCLRLATEAETPWVVMDRSQLEQVLLNIVVNAKDAMPEGGELHLRCGSATIDPDRAHRLGLAPGMHAQIEVRDTGVGMDPRTQAQIFEPFFTTKGVGRGTGLGLSTVYGVVQQAGGQVEVESELGRGTTFRIYLPRVELGASDDEAIPAPTQAPRAPGGHETVLLVEDDPGVREMAARILRGRGYHVLTAQSCEQALLVAAGHMDRIDILLCDVELGDGQGRDVVEALRTKGRHVPVVLMSGYSTEGLLLSGSVGEHALLHKPFHPDELAQTVRSALGGAVARCEGGDRAPTPPEADPGVVDG